MVAIIYSGSHFAVWKIADKGKIVEDFKTVGINPFFHDKKHIVHLLGKKTELINHAENIRQVYFFGAGASSKERRKMVIDGLRGFFRFAKVHVHHDMDAAALITCNKEPGLVSIIGSGSNAAYFDGKKVLGNNFGLGYVLGDEGSSNWLGKELLKSYLHQSLPENLLKKFNKKYIVDRRHTLDKIYRNPHPVLYLSTFAEFLIEHKDDAYCREMIKKGFRKLFDLYILPLSHKHPQVPLHFTGTIAGAFQEYLYEVAEEKQIQISTVIKEPVHNLLTHYINKN